MNNQNTAIAMKLRPSSALASAGWTVPGTRRPKTVGADNSTLVNHTHQHPSPSPMV
ncbi:hypothetical protein ACTQ49_00625 [Luteococcus sp. Sow4_B9]|uniref:hypothetical protein n=1 Tax=Luteococcus sp. Sow4_B9 TaxID=3438792 RepID=UPI003F97DBBC